ncbi:P-loop NTPase [Lachnospiraceae bacterium YH-ros2226]
MPEEKHHLTPEERAARVKRTAPAAGKKEERKPDLSGNGPMFAEQANPHSNVKHVIGIVSGKGGVGKSFLTASLANKLGREGYKTAIMDADITGPSIPKMFGVKGPLLGSEDGAYPVEAEDGTKIVSMNLILENDEQPVVWRGPVIAGTVKQFWTDIMWGNVDYMFVDMPPGTGDVPLTVFQSLPVDGIIIVTSPQDLVSMIVKKAINMAEMMKIPVLGLVENYSYIQCPDCGKKIQLFGKSHIEEVAKEFGLPVLGQIPLDPKNAELADAGKIYENDNTYLDQAVRTLEALQ